MISFLKVITKKYQNFEVIPLHFDCSQICSLNMPRRCFFACLIRSSTRICSQSTVFVLKSIICKADFSYVIAKRCQNFHVISLHLISFRYASKHASKEILSRLFNKPFLKGIFGPLFFLANGVYWPHFLDVIAKA